MMGNRMIRIVFLAAIFAALGFGGGPARAEGDATSGQKLFGQRCAFCHSIAAAERKPLGPELAGVFGRKAASIADYKYSPAFAALTVTWDDKSLDEFLVAPAKLAPGTPMAIGVPQAADREDLIAYLKSVK